MNGVQNYLPQSVILLDGFLLAVAPVLHANLDILQLQLIGFGQRMFYDLFLMIINNIHYKRIQPRAQLLKYHYNIQGEQS